MHELIYSFKLKNKSQILQWHHENVVVACLSADEVHTPPSDPQEKLHLLKSIKNIEKISRNTLKITRKSRPQGKISLLVSF